MFIYHMFFLLLPLFSLLRHIAKNTLRTSFFGKCITHIQTSIAVVLFVAFLQQCTGTNFTFLIKCHFNVGIYFHNIIILSCYPCILSIKSLVVPQQRTGTLPILIQILKQIYENLLFIIFSNRSEKIWNMRYYLSASLKEIKYLVNYLQLLVIAITKTDYMNSKITNDVPNEFFFGIPTKLFKCNLYV